MKLAINNKLGPILLATVIIGATTGYFLAQGNRKVALLTGAGMIGTGAVMWRHDK